MKRRSPYRPFRLCKALPDEHTKHYHELRGAGLIFVIAWGMFAVFSGLPLLGRLAVSIPAVCLGVTLYMLAPRYERWVLTHRMGEDPQDLLKVWTVGGAVVAVLGGASFLVFDTRFGLGAFFMGVVISVGMLWARRLSR